MLSQTLEFSDFIYFYTLHTYLSLIIYMFECKKAEEIKGNNILHVDSHDFMHLIFINLKRYRASMLKNKSKNISVLDKLRRPVRTRFEDV